MQHGANPNQINPPFVLSSLSIAITKRDQKSAKWEAGIDKEIFGDTSQVHRQMIFDTIIAILLKYVASPTLESAHGPTSLHRAAEYCDSSVAEKLLSIGAPLNAKDKDGNTPEDMTKKNNCVSVLAVIQKYKDSKK